MLTKNKKGIALFGFVFVGLFILASCNLPFLTTSPNTALGSNATSLSQPTTSLSLTDQAKQTLSPVATSAQETLAVLPSLLLTVATQNIVHQMMPGDPGINHESGMTDADSSSSAASKSAAAGENFSAGLYERPFNANTMDQYFPALDIVQTWLNRTRDWVFVMIRLHDVDSQGKLSGSYAAEFDLNLDGRGDILVLAKQPANAWSVEGVQVWQDTNKAVGGIIPVISDAQKTGSGYETMLFDSGKGSDPDLAWARVDPNNPRIVQIALKYSAINNDAGFLWGAWAQDVIHPEWFDYNDHFSIAEAGSASTLQAQYYPIKALAEVDNTCRWALGFKPTGDEPGICFVVKPTATPTLPPENKGNPSIDPTSRPPR